MVPLFDGSGTCDELTPFCGLFHIRADLVNHEEQQQMMIEQQLKNRSMGDSLKLSRPGSAQLDTLSLPPASEPAQQALLGRRQCQEVEFVQQAFLARTARLHNSSWDPVLKTNGAEPTTASAHGLSSTQPVCPGLSPLWTGDTSCSVSISRHVC